VGGLRIASEQNDSGVAALAVELDARFNEHDVPTACVIPVAATFRLMLLRSRMGSRMIRSLTPPRGLQPGQQSPALPRDRRPV